MKYIGRASIMKTQNSNQGPEETFSPIIPKGNSRKSNFLTHYRNRNSINMISAFAKNKESE